MILSIIIAAYNIEKYISDCLFSCITQDIPSDKYEIIVVNDGSTDGTREIVEDYIEKHNNIRIIDKTNGGLSSARNTGLRQARGEYVWFVDGDDKIQKNCLGKLAEIISEDRFDCYMINYSTFELDDDVSEKQLKGYPTIPINPNEYIKSAKTIMPMMAWLTIASRQFLERHELLFTVGIIHEDLDFSVREMSLCKAIKFIDLSLYLYRINRSGSIMSKRNRLKSLNSLYNIYNIWQDFFEKYKTDTFYINIAMAILSNFIFFNKDYNKMNIINKDAYSNELKRRIWLGPFKLRIKLLIFLFFPKSVFYKLFPHIG